MNTGHDGSLTTGHANSTRDMLARLETMVLMAGMNLPLPAIRQQIASAIDIIVQQSRMRDGSRKIIGISEVLGMEGEVIVTQEIFTFDYGDGRTPGRFRATGIKPRVADKLVAAGAGLKDEWFQ